MQSCNAVCSPDVKLLRKSNQGDDRGKLQIPLTQQMLIVAEHSLRLTSVISCQEAISRLFFKQETMITGAGMT